MMTFTEWLELPTKHRENTLEAEREVPRHERISFLVACNGGWDVGGWGYISHSGGPFRRGLEQDEAITLVFYGGVFEGLTLAGVDSFTIFQPYYKKYYDARQAAYEASKVGV